MGKLLTGNEAHIPSLPIKFELKWEENTIQPFFIFYTEKMLLNSFSLTNPVPQLLTIKARSLSGPNSIKSRAAKLRETLLINFYKWCNASFSFSNSQCGCYFRERKGKSMRNRYVIQQNRF